ncbi:MULTISPECIES: DUF1127 domain-containing protein [Thioclava]|nr:MULTISPECIES: DUF1127 domain-containing protein [Thioclava]
MYPFYSNKDHIVSIQKGITMFTLSRTRPVPARHGRLSLIARVARVLEARRSRMALGKLDDHLLEDIGISREIARQEGRRFL